MGSVTIWLYMFQIFMFESVLKIQSMLKSVMHVENILKKSWKL